MGSSLVTCLLGDKDDAQDLPPNAQERALQYMQEGKVLDSDGYRR